MKRFQFSSMGWVVFVGTLDIACSSGLPGNKDPDAGAGNPNTTGGTTSGVTHTGGKTGSSSASSSLGGQSNVGGSASNGGTAAVGGMANTNDTSAVGSSSTAGSTIGGSSSTAASTSVGGTKAVGGGSGVGGSNAIGGTGATTAGGTNGIGGTLGAGGSNATVGGTNVGGMTSAGGTTALGGTTSAGGNSAAIGGQSGLGGSGTGCDPGLNLCGSTCVDLLTTAAHCGNCDTICDPGQICSKGGCKTISGCGVAPTTTRYFCEDFEAGLDNWSISGYDWNLTTAKSHSATHCLTDSPDGNYAAGASMVVSMTKSFDLSTATAPVLTFWNTGNYNPGNPGTNTTYSYIHVSTNAGLTWTQLWNRNNWGLSNWFQELIDFSAYVGKTGIKLRFTLSTSSYTADGWYIDDIEVRELQ
jgi:hypothetical protein